MADETTRLTISIETILRGLDKTLRGLQQVEKQLKSLSNLKATVTGAQSLNQTANAANRAAQAALKLQIQQQKLANQQQRLTVLQQRGAITTQRLAVATQRLGVQQQQVANAQVRAQQATQRLQQVQQRLTQGAQAATAAHSTLNRQLGTLGNSLRSIGQGFASLGATLTVAVSAPLAAIGANAVEAAVRMDSLRRGLSAIVGSASEAQVQLRRLTEIAKLPGIGFEEAIEGSIRLQAVGFSAKEAEKSLVEFSNAVALTGGGREELSRITVQLGQLAAKGKVLAQDLKPIIEAAPAVGRALLEAFGTVNSEDIQALGLSSKEFLSILVDQLGQLPRAAAGARNAFDNFRDTVFRTSAAVGEILLPVLTKLVEVAGPIITSLAETFKSLPAPIQGAIVGVTGLAIATGPLLFIFGQLVTGIGRVLVGLVQLNTLGLLNIGTFRLLGQVMIGTASLVQGSAATAAAAATGWGLLAVAIIGVVGLIGAIAAFSSATKEQTETTEQQADATKNEIKVLKTQQAELDKVAKATKTTTTEQSKLKEVYDSLSRASQGRVLVMEKELGLTKALQQEVARLITAREGEQRIQAATIAAGITTTAQQVETLGKSLDLAIARVNRLQQARDSLTRTGRFTQQQLTDDPFLRGIASLDTVRQLEKLDEKLKELSEDTLPDLRKQSDEAVEALSKQNAVLERLESSTGKTTREILQQAKELGLFKGDVELATRGILAFREAQLQLEAALSGTSLELLKQRREFLALGQRADDAEKRRRETIESAIAQVREGSNTVDEAKKKLKELIDTNKEVREAIETENKKRPLEDFLRIELGLKKGGSQRSETGIRNARQALADAITQVALAQSEAEVQIEREKNERLIRAAEVGQRLRIISLRQFLELRSQLNAATLDREIGQQQEIVKAARLAQARLARAAQQAGIPEAERLRRQAQAAQANEEAIKAETKLSQLRVQQENVETELAQELRLAQDDQLQSVRQLEIEYAQLQGRIEDALKAEAVEQFRVRLQELTVAQRHLNAEIKKAKEARDVDRVAQLESERQLNQREIESITNQIRLRDSLAQLAAAEQLVTNAKEKQQKIEEDLQFQVQFRGLSEEESIKRRLEGEDKLRASMELALSIIRDTQRALIDLGLTPPPDLQKFLDDVETARQGLGELSFTEQFRLAGKEFERINDERLRRIADVERAVRNRDIAEIEGMLLIRQINGQYAGDLEAQLVLLKQIAAASGDASLQRQAQSAEETVKDANDRLADFNTQLRSTSIDALRDGFTDFFRSLGDNTVTAKEKLLNLVDSVVGRIEDVIAENLSKQLIESLFGGEGAGDGIIAGIKRFFGFGGGGEGKAGIADVAGGAAGKATEVAAATALTTGAATAATALVTGGTATATAITAAAAAFAAAVTAAGAAFAAAVAAAGVASGGQSIVAGLSGSGIGNFAKGDILPAQAGGRIVRVAEGGFPEAVITTDPAHAVKQVRILSKILKMTRGFGGRVQMPDLASGALVTPRQAEMNLLSGIQRAPRVSGNVGDLPLTAAAGGDGGRFRFVLTDQRSFADWATSSEGEQVIRGVLIKNRPLLIDLSGRR